MPTAHGDHDARAAYWRRNLRYVGALLLVWFAVSFGAGILFVEPLNRIRIPGTGFPLGFWFAQQGAIYVFVILIFVYVRLMNRLDREFRDGRSDGPGEVGGPTGGGRGGEARP
jgi:putative solute:sodium symporter small subunit